MISRTLTSKLIMIVMILMIKFSKMEKKNDNKGTNNGNRGKTVINNTSNTACNDETSSEYVELCH